MPSAPDKELIRARALQLGAYRCGFAIADVVAEPQRRIYAQWIADGKHGTMDYCARYSDVRDDPRLLLPGAQTVISCAFYYDTGVRNPHIATYALGADYHYVLKHRLAQLGDWLVAQYGGEYRALVDTAPMRERYWAQQAGIGFIGLNNHLIIPGAGSYFFLAELLWTIPLPPDVPSASAVFCSGEEHSSSASSAISVDSTSYLEVASDSPQFPAVANVVEDGTVNKVVLATPPETADKAEPAMCGEATTVDAAAMRAACEQCRACVRACPNGALDGNGGCDARRCISYLTIEHRGDLPADMRLAGQIYGCDICQQVCPHNRHKQTLAEGAQQAAEAQLMASVETAAGERPVPLPEFAANPEIAALDAAALSQMTPSHYKRLTSKSALRRAPFPQLLRNAHNSLLEQ